MQGKRQLTGRARRKLRVRKKIFGTAARPRLSVFRSAKHIYAQVIDDTAHCTLAAAATLGHGQAGMGGEKLVQAKGVGDRIAAACLAKNIEAVVFDRNGFEYHGRVRAVAEAARAHGLKF